MKTIVLNGSPRKGGNTEALIEAFVRGAREKGDVEVLRVCDFDVKPCCGCNGCKKEANGRCVMHDDMMYFWEKISKADVLVAATPVYFYGVSAQLKAVIDRFHAPARKDLPIKKLGLLLVAADSREAVFDSIKDQYAHITSFFGLGSIGVLSVPGVRERGDIADSPFLKKAEEMGRNIEQ